jgi:DNA-binding NarL/FixJ family response regulator
MTSQEVIQALDLTIDALIRRHATEEEIEDAVRAIYIEENA